MASFLKLSHYWLNVDQIRAVKLNPPDPVEPDCHVILGDEGRLPASGSAIGLKGEDARILLDFLERNQVERGASIPMAEPAP